MRIKRFAIFLGILVVFILVLAWRLGAFREVNMVESEQPEFLLAGEWTHAPYREILDYANRALLPLVKSNPGITGLAGLYFDNPELIVADSLRAFVGVICQDSSLAPPGMTLKLVTAQPAITTSFSGSPIIGRFKIYPAAERWFQANGDTAAEPILEIYYGNQKEKRVIYYFPIAKDEN